jgi:hypothetical protein
MRCSVMEGGKVVERDGETDSCLEWCSIHAGKHGYCFFELKNEEIHILFVVVEVQARSHAACCIELGV